MWETERERIRTPCADLPQTRDAGMDDLGAAPPEPSLCTGRASSSSDMSTVEVQLAPPSLCAWPGWVLGSTRPRDFRAGAWASPGAATLGAHAVGGRAGGWSWASTAPPSGQGSPAASASREERNEEWACPSIFWWTTRIGQCIFIWLGNLRPWIWQ
jgi:hypothetical protein